MKISEMKREELAERLILSVLNAEQSKERLFNFPNIIKGGFALVSQLCLGDKNMEGQYTSCITVTNDILNGWEISRPEMFELAAENSKKLFPVLVEPLENLMQSLSEDEKKYFQTDGINLPNSFVLSNKMFFNGAAAMFYEPEVLDKLAKKCKTDNLFLFPSSTNHIFCIPSSDLLSKEECMEIQKNFASDSEDPVLSDQIMVYDAKTKLVSYEDRPFSPYINGDLANSITSDLQNKQSSHR